jgi:ATP-dependent helicase/DNAse subunit B
LEPIKLSASSISKFQVCAKKFWFDKVSNLEDREFTSGAIERGTLFHAGIAAALRQRDPRKNLDVAISAVNELYLAGTGSIVEQDEAIEMLRYYLNDLGINTRNFAVVRDGVPLVEYEFERNFGDFNLRGSIDAVIQGEDGSVFLVDWKTRRTFYTDDVVEMDKQLYIYAKILELEGIKLTGAMQIQLNAPPQAPKFKVNSDPNLASSLNEKSARTTKALFDETISHMTPSEQSKALMKLGSKVVGDYEFKKVSSINLNDVDAFFDTVLAWGHKIAQTTNYLPIMDAYICKGCVWRPECRGDLRS